ncbi:hypothetical protein [Streptomyces sp. NPDC088766]|uniref:hypothetical protein n=1 Tax=Streptomyces sp. NPDC088766 TaxID=3365893 RepID=UPI00381F3BB1
MRAGPGQVPPARLRGFRLTAAAVAVGIVVAHLMATAPPPLLWHPVTPSDAE